MRQRAAQDGIESLVVPVSQMLITPEVLSDEDRATRMFPPSIEPVIWDYEIWEFFHRHSVEA